MQVVLDAILENAYFFSRKNKGDDAKIELNYKVDDKGLNLTVKDNGCGIPEDFIAEADKMFFVGSKLSKGNGLGLSLAKSALEQIGGKMRISSKQDEYSRVEVYIPKY